MLRRGAILCLVRPNAMGSFASGALTCTRCMWKTFVVVQSCHLSDYGWYRLCAAFAPTYLPGSKKRFMSRVLPEMCRVAGKVMEVGVRNMRVLSMVPKIPVVRRVHESTCRSVL